jgi:hypothetical protein
MEQINIHGILWWFLIRKSRVKSGQAAEKEEQDFMRAARPVNGFEALAPLGTDEHKPFFRNRLLI